MQIELSNNELQAFQNYAAVVNQKKEIEKREKEIKEQLLELMEYHGVKKIDNEILTLTYIAESKTVNVDWKAVKAEEPEVYEELLNDFPKVSLDEKRLEDEEPSTFQGLKDDYPKETKRKAHVRVKVK